MSHNTHSNAGQNAGRVLYALRGINCKMQIAKCKLQNGGEASQSPVPSHQSRRSGISLTEVLIAMGILTVGLLGVAAIFPVAGFYMQRGEIADRGSAIAQAAFNHAVASGQLDPAGWWSMTHSQQDPTYDPNNAKDSYKVFSTDGLDQSFSRPVYDALQASKSLWSVPQSCQRMGSVYVIDPLGAAALADYEQPAYASAIARTFPIVPLTLLGDASKYAYGPKWQPWIGTGSRPIFPIRRVTFRRPRSDDNADSADPYPATRPLDRAMAERQFMSVDDLAIDMPDQADRPSQQMLSLASVGGEQTALARQSQGNYSWLLTVVPSDQYNLYAGPAEVSAVVFYKRPLGSPPETPTESLEASRVERIVKASIVSTGLSGGEVLLAPIDDGITENPFQQLRTGLWIMLCGPHPTSPTLEEMNRRPDAKPQFVARWYRVLAIEEEGANRRVTLRGPNWPWQPDANASGLSNHLCAGIFPGAVAVHSKTIRLGSSGATWAGGSGGVFGGSVSPNIFAR